MLFLWNYSVFFFILKFIESTVSVDTDLMYKKLYSCNEKCNAPLLRQESNNFRKMLDFIRKSPEFDPLKLSVVVPHYESNFVDFLLKYIGETSIEAYTIGATDLSLKSTWNDRTNLTWAFFITDVYNLDIFISWQQEIWKARNQYLIIFTGKGVTVHWRDVFKSLWKKYKVYRAVIISAQDEFRCLMKYMPFEGHKNKFGSVHKVCLHEKSNRNTLQNSVISENVERLLRLTNADKVVYATRNMQLFENFNNLNGYPVNVLVFPSLLMDISYDEQNKLRLDNVDGKIAVALEKAMGAMFHIKKTSKHIAPGDDPFVRALSYIENEHAEMVITGFFVKGYNMFSKFAFTSALYEDKVCFLSPDSGLVPKAYMPFMPFEKSLWAILIIYNILITLIWQFVQYTNESLRDQRPGNGSNKIRPEINYTDNETFVTNRSQVRYGMKSSSFIDKFPNSWQTSTFQRYKRHAQQSKFNSMVPYRRTEPPKIPQYLLKFFFFLEMLCYPFQSAKTRAQKFLLIFILFFGMIMNGVYQSCLVSTLSKPFHYPQLHTLEDVVDSKKTLITKYANLINFFDCDSSLDRKLHEMIHIVNTSRSIKDLVAYDDKIAITRYFTMVTGDYAYYNEEGIPQLYVVDEAPMNYRVSYVLRQNSPYEERVNFILLRLKEAGLINNWFDNMLHPVMIVKRRRKEQLRNRIIKLTLDHYSLTFLLLFVGLLGATLMFFAEVYVASKAKEKREET